MEAKEKCQSFQFAQHFCYKQHFRQLSVNLEAMAPPGGVAAWFMTPGTRGRTAAWRAEDVLVCGEFTSHAILFHSIW